MARTYIGALRGSMSMDTADWSQNFKQAEKNVNAFRRSVDQKAKRIEAAGKSMEKFSRSMFKNVIAPAAAAATGILALAHKTAEYADEIDKMSIRTGFSTDSLQEMRFAASQLGVEFGSVQSVMESFTRRIPQLDKGTSDSALAFQRLGIELRDASGNMRQSEDLFFDLIRALGRMENEVDRNAIGTQILGRNFFEIVPLLSAGEEGLNKLRREAHELGLIMSGEGIQSAVEYKDELDKLKQQFGAISRELGLELIPLLKDDFIPWIRDEGVPAVRDMIDTMKGWIDTYRDLTPRQKDNLAIVMKSVVGITALSFAAGKVLKIAAPLVKTVGWLATTTAGVTTSVIGLTAGLTGLAVAENQHFKNLGRITEAQDRLNQATADQDLEELRRLYGDLTKQYNDNAKVLERLEENYRVGGGEAAHLKTRINSLRESQSELLEELSLVSKTMKFVTAQKQMDAVASNAAADGVRNHTEAIRDYRRELGQLPAIGLELTDTYIQVNTQLERQNYLMREQGHILGEWWGKMDEMISRYTDLEVAAERFGERVFYSSVVAGRGLQDLANTAIDSARQVIAAKLYEAIAHILAASFASFGPLGFAVASAGAAAVTSLFNSLIPSFSQGGIVYSPTLAMIGDRPGSPEVVMGLDQLNALVQTDQRVYIVPRTIRSGDIEWSQERRSARRYKTL